MAKKDGPEPLTKEEKDLLSKLKNKNLSYARWEEEQEDKEYRKRVKAAQIELKSLQEKNSNHEVGLEIKATFTPNLDYNNIEFFYCASISAQVTVVKYKKGWGVFPNDMTDTTKLENLIADALRDEGIDPFEKISDGPNLNMFSLENMEKLVEQYRSIEPVIIEASFIGEAIDYCSVKAKNVNVVAPKGYKNKIKSMIKLYCNEICDIGFESLFPNYDDDDLIYQIAEKYNVRDFDL